MKKIVQTLAIAILMMSTFCLNVEASANVQTELTASVQEVKTSEEVSLTIGFQKVEDTTKGINAYHAKFDYDTDVFEEINYSDFENQNRWTSLQYNKANHELVAVHKAGIHSEEELAKVTLRVRKDAPAGETKVGVRQFVTSEGKRDIEAEDSEVTLAIVKSADDNEENGSEDGKKPSGGNSSTGDKKPSGSKDSESGNKSGKGSAKTKAADSVKPGKSPKTGDYAPVFICVLFLLEAGLIFLVFRYYKKTGKKNRRLSLKTRKIILTAVITVVGLQIVGTVYAAGVTLHSRGDVNKDDSVDDVDIVLLEKHLIELEVLPEENWKAGDMNLDGKITVTDLSGLVWKVEGKEDFVCELGTVTPESYYTEKGQEVTFEFEAEANRAFAIEAVQVNGERYSVEETDNGTYTITVPAGKEAGVKTFAFEKLFLSEGEEKEIETDKETKIEVLKSKPSIENYEVEENADDSKVTVKFTLNDADNALTAASFTVEKLGVSEELKAGECAIELDVEEGKTYSALIALSYDLDTNELNDITGDKNTGDETIPKEIQLNVAYDLKVSDIGAYKGEKEASVFTREDEVTLRFKSTNATKHIPETVKINGTEYEVTKEEDNTYAVSLGKIMQTGKHTLTIEEVTLSNGKVLAVKDAAIEIEIEKAAPEIADFETDEKEDSIDFTFKVQDEDNVMENAFLILLDGDGNEIARQDITKDTQKVSLETAYTDKYTVKVIADYALSSSGEQKEKTIFQEEITAKLKARVSEAVVGERYVEKGGNVEITYKFESNRPLDIRVLQINYTEYYAAETGENTYHVFVPAKDAAGVQDFVLRKFLSGERAEEVSVDNTVQAEVLKDKPYVTDYAVTDNWSKGEVTVEFDLADPDGAFQSGYTVLETEDGKIVEGSKKEIQAGKNQITYSVTPNEIYKEKYYISYDLDTDGDNGENEAEEELLDTRQIQLAGNYEVKVSEIKTLTAEGEEAVYFQKGEAFKLQFQAKSNTIYQPQKVTLDGREYPLTEEDSAYCVELEGYDDSGLKKIRFDSITLDNGHVVMLEDVTGQIDVLKDKPSVTGFTYETNDEKTKMTAHMEVHDEENALTALKAEIFDEDGALVKEVDLFEKYKQNAGIDFSFEISDSKKSYQIQITGDYDLDSNELGTGENEKKDELFLEETVETGARPYELKDIKEIVLYRKDGDNVSAVSEVELASFQPDEYIVKVIMEKQESYYAKISRYEVRDGKLYFILETSNIVQYEENKKTDNVSVEYGTVADGSAKRMTLDVLIQKMKDDPSGTYELTGDLDASSVTSNDASLFSVNFAGTLNGNGYKIYNLNKPLFTSLNGAVIENLVIDNAKVSGKGAILAPTTTTAVIENVHLTGSVLSGNISPSGGFIGHANGTTKITNSSITDSSITGGKRTGGFIGWAANSAEVPLRIPMFRGISQAQAMLWAAL